MRFAEEVEEIRNRTRSAFATTYLTLLSVMQGTALAALYVKVDSLIERQEFHPLQMTLTAGIFLTVVLLWNQYQMGLMLYYWTATLFDVTVPFMFAAFEFAMIIAIRYGAAAVLTTLGLFFAVGIAALEHQYWQIRRNARAAAFMHVLTRGFRALDIAACVLSAVILLGTAAVISRAPTEGNQLVGAWILVAVAIGHAVREVSEWGLAQRRLTAHAGKCM